MLLQPEALDEAPHERRLADPGLAGDEEDDRASLAVLERPIERVELARPPDERYVLRLRRGPRARCGPEEVEHPLRARSLRGVEAEKLDRELVQVGGDPLDERARCRRELLLFSEKDVERRTLERDATRQRLVEHHSHGVPVGLGPDGARRGLLRRHVLGRADDLVGGQLVFARVDDETEIEEDDAPPLGHEHVGRLDVAMNHPFRVENA